jgi:predicted nucleic acid-binding protein
MPTPEATRRRVVICDASPLIFLAKLAALELIERVIPGRLVVLECVVREVLSERAGPVEVDRLRQWLQGVEVLESEGSLFPSSVLSKSDQSTLAWAVNHGAAWLVCDERLLRRVARQRGMGVIGFCGILVKAVERGHLSPREARAMLDAAVDQHGLRISVALYRRIIETFV